MLMPLQELLLSVLIVLLTIMLLTLPGLLQKILQLLLLPTTRGPQMCTKLLLLQQLQGRYKQVFSLTMGSMVMKKMNRMQSCVKSVMQLGEPAVHAMQAGAHDNTWADL